MYDLKEVKIESFWGAVASLLLFQIFGFITFNAFLSYFISGFSFLFLYGFLWIFIFMLADSAIFDKFKKYLANENALSPMESLHQLDDFLKFCMSILFIVILILFSLGYYPLPKSEYTLYSLIVFYVFSWIVSYIISMTLKKYGSRMYISSQPCGLMCFLIGGIIFFIVSYLIAKELIYIFGMIGMGVSVLAVSSWLLEDQIKPIK